MSVFRKVSYNEPHVVHNRERYSMSLQNFREFAEKLSIEGGNVKKTSSKGTHYARFLLYLTVLYEEIFHKEFGTLDSFEALKRLKLIEALPDFRKFNQDEHNFYSAAINCFSAYLTAQKLSAETFADDQLNARLMLLTNDEEMRLSEDSPEYLDGDPSPVPPQSMSYDFYTYPRKLKVSYLAKIRSNWSCELNPEHRTFNAQRDGKNFVEAHHLVPMAVQDYYHYTLDFTDNVMTLCPNCHRLVHFAEYHQRAEAITKLFSEREKMYDKHGIEVDQKLLLSFYGIL